jgi:hypothetical protein
MSFVALLRGLSIVAGVGDFCPQQVFGLAARRVFVFALFVF